MENWEKSVIEKVLLETVKEQRRSRRWKIFFRLIWILIIGGSIYMFSSSSNSNSSNPVKVGAQVGVVDLTGVIDGDNKTYENISQGLRDALNDKHTVAVIIRANSPGGSPVYSDMLYNEILRLRKVYPKKPISVVVEQVCASGCYYIAAAANKIYASPASIIGSIGVIYAGFGFTGIMQKVGIDSRLKISGKNKAMGYPFLPINSEQDIMQQQMLDEIHNQFISAVKQGRKDKLDLTNQDLFSGRYWLGADGVKLGLIDGIDTVDGLARREFNSENIVDFTVSQDFMSKIAKKAGVTLMSSAKQAIIDSKIEFGAFN